MPNNGALIIGQALKAARFDAPSIARALISPEVYPALTAGETGRVLLDPTMFPTLTRSEMAAALTAASFPAAAVAAALAALYPSVSANLSWNFSNIVTQGAVSTCAATSAPSWATATLSQTGGGPSENFTVNGKTFPVFLTRFLGTQYPFIRLTLQQPAKLESVSFSHYHNHNPGFPSNPSYQIQIQIDSGPGFVDIGQPFLVDSANNEATAQVDLGGFSLSTGTLRLRWYPKGLANGAADTNTEYFAIANLALTLASP